MVVSSWELGVWGSAGLGDVKDVGGGFGDDAHTRRLRFFLPGFVFNAIGRFGKSKLLKIRTSKFGLYSA